MDTAILEDIGLTQAEIKVYVALLELGSCTAGPLLEKSGLQNSVVHRALHSLIEKGLISFIQEGKRKIYQATDPEQFYAFIEDKKQRFTRLLPALKQKQQFSNKPQKATVYHGKRGINELYRQLLEAGGKEYLTFGGGSRVTHEVMGESWWKNLHQKRLAKKLPSRQVFDETIRKFGAELNKLPKTLIKFLPQEFEQLTETIICGKKVGLAIFTENPYGLLIEDAVVAEGYAKQFELIWRQAKD